MAEEQDRIDQLIYRSHDEDAKLDYFILGATLTICAYLAQTNPYGRLGINKETFLLCSLLVFASSAVYGFKRLEAKLVLMYDNTKALQIRDPNTRKRRLNELGDRSVNRIAKFYRARNRLLFAGLACYLVTKVWASYQNSGWILVN
ncbi:hypothetical protein [Pseudomonas sp. LB3P14]